MSVFHLIYFLKSYVFVQHKEICSLEDPECMFFRYIKRPRGDDFKASAEEKGLDGKQVSHFSAETISFHMEFYLSVRSSILNSLSSIHEI